jgi:uncharacterized protein
MKKNMLLYIFCLITFIKFSYAADNVSLGVMERIKSRELNWIEKAIAGEIYVDEINVDGETALILAIIHRQQEKAFQLLSKGAKVNLTNRNNETPLLMASQRGNLELVKKLLSLGANPNIAHNGLAISPLSDRNTGLYYAAVNGHQEIVRALITPMPSIPVDSDCCTPGN